MTYTEILQNPHFNQFAAILSVAMSAQWIMAHPEVPSVRSTVEHQLMRLNRGMCKDARNIKEDFMRAWTLLFTQLVEASPKLRYGVEDMQWFVEVMDGDESMARTTFSMLFAYASASQRFLVVEEVARLTGLSPVTWRQRAERGEVVGAFKAGGKAWIFPVLALRAYGVWVPAEASSEVDEASSESEE